VSRSAILSGHGETDAQAPPAAVNPLPVVENRAKRGSIGGDLVEIAAELYHHRDLLYQLTRRDIRIRYKQAVMGFAWAVFMPVVIVLAGLVVRFAMAQVSGSPLVMTEMAGVAVKALPWAFFVGAIGFATPSLVGNMNLVTKIYFPREVLPLSATLAQTFDSAIGAVVLFLALPLMGVALTTGLLWVPPLLLVLFLFTAATCLFLSCANLFFRDVKYIVQVVLTFGIFFTPVLFEPAMFGAVGAQLIMLNPIAPIIEGFRLAVVEGHNLLLPLVETSAAGREILAWSPWYLVSSLVWSVGGLLGSALLFHRSEFIFAEYV
jgi:lipopolysaccharide transport system permease protein